MAVYFFDSSGIAKRYVRETGTAWVILAPGPRSPEPIGLLEIPRGRHVETGSQSGLGREGSPAHPTT